MDWYTTANHSVITGVSTATQHFFNEHGVTTIDHAVKLCNRTFGDRPWVCRHTNDRAFRDALAEIDTIVGGPLSQSIFDWRLTDTPWLHGLTKLAGEHVLSKITSKGGTWTIPSDIDSREKLQEFALTLKGPTDYRSIFDRKEIRAWIPEMPPPIVRDGSTRFLREAKDLYAVATPSEREHLINLLRAAKTTNEKATKNLKS